MTGAERLVEQRGATRDAAAFDATAFGPDGRHRTLRVVNLSATGLMTMTEGALPIGGRLRIVLPVVGVMPAEVRWCARGRIGIEFDMAIGRADYFELLAAVL